MRTLIKNGTCVTATDTFAADLLIERGKISALVAPGTNLGAVDKTIDATGQYVFPGGIDAHTHMELPFGGTTASDDFDTGTVAAAFGGKTTMVDLAIQSKGSSMRAGLDAWHAKSEGKAAIDYGFHMIMTEANPSTLEDMAAMVREGVTSFKMFMAYPGVFLVDDQQIFRAMLRAGELGGLITMHAEIGLPIDVLVQRALSQGHTAPIYHALTRPEIAEATGTERAIALAEMA
jgi:dihydropyrimidinase